MTYLLPLTSMDCCSYKPCAIVCKFMMLLSGLATVAALVGLYVAHFGASGSFGTTAASLSLIAFAVNLVVFWKFGKAHCPGCNQCCSGKK